MQRPRSTTPLAGDPRRRDVERPWYAFAERVLPDGDLGRWLDLGCGFGEFCERASSRPGRAAFGADLDGKALREARARGIPVVYADFSRSLPFADASFDGASMIEVIEHVFDTRGLLEDLARIVRPGGWLVLTTPNVAHLTYRVRALRGRPPKQEGRHMRFFTRDRLKAVVEGAGFRLEESASYGKQAALTKVARWTGRNERDEKVRYRVPAAFESLLAQHFVWRLRRRG